MADIVLTGNTSGAITVAAPAVAGTNTLTLPASTGTLATTAGGVIGLDSSGGVARATSGLLFNADTAAANTLDDYEEGLWTPTFTSTSATFTYASQYGSYLKVGNLVTAQFYLNATAAGTTSNGVVLSSLPFTALSISNLAQYSGSVWSTTTANITPLVNYNQTRATIWKNNGAVQTLVASEMSGKYFVGTVIYRAA
jgi:hypothetical protein